MAKSRRKRTPKTVLRLPDLEHSKSAVVAQVPRLTTRMDLSTKAYRADSFLALYTTITKDDIRRNRKNAAERLGFLGRVIHGTNPRAWLKEIRQRMGEGIDFTSTVGD